MPAISLRRATAGVTAVLLSTLLVNGAAGFVLLTNAHVDPLRHTDAIIVLGGEHDGREDFGLGLARDGWAKTVVLSNSYAADDPVMARACRPQADIEVICLRPVPNTTRGEADMMRRLADERGWTTVTVASWRYHLPRARLIFRQCFSEQSGSVSMQAVPRRYHFSFVHWEFVFAYQWGGLAKAVYQEIVTDQRIRA